MVLIQIILRIMIDTTLDLIKILPTRLSYIYIVISCLKTHVLFSQFVQMHIYERMSLFRGLDETPCICLIEVRVIRNCSFNQEHDVLDITARS